MGRGRGNWSEQISDEDYQRKIVAKVIQNGQGCWLWQGYRHPKGYGEMGYRGRVMRLHRLAYQLWRGPIPDGLVVCHTCDIRNCVNPLHLFLGTFDINNKDMAAKGRCKYSAAVWPECKHGHEFTLANTWVDSRGFRQCRECARVRMRRDAKNGKALERQRRYRARKKAERMQQLSES